MLLLLFLPLLLLLILFLLLFLFLLLPRQEPAPPCNQPGSQAAQAPCPVRWERGLWAAATSCWARGKGTRELLGASSAETGTRQSPAIPTLLTRAERRGRADQTPWSAAALPHFVFHLPGKTHEGCEPQPAHPSPCSPSRPRGQARSALPTHSNSPRAKHWLLASAFPHGWQSAAPSRHGARRCRDLFASYKTLGSGTRPAQPGWELAALTLWGPSTLGWVLLVP